MKMEEDMRNYIPAAHLEKLQKAAASAVEEMSPEMSVQRLISYYGTGSACDRIFVAGAADGGDTEITFEWCDRGVEPWMPVQEGSPLSGILNIWAERFRQEETGMIRYPEKSGGDSEENAPARELPGSPEGTRLILVPMRLEGNFLGFLGIENPAPDEMEEMSVTARVLADFAAALIGRRESEEMLRDILEKDVLTGLCNRRTFYEKVREAILHRDPDSRACVVYLNASNFKDFNAYYGPEAGDQCLVRIGQMIREFFGTDLVGRTYSDHFYVYYEGGHETEIIRKLHEECLKLRKHFQVWIQAGICPVKEGDSVEKICDAAKIACDRLPDDNVSFCSTYSSEILDRLHQEKYIQDNIGNAIEKGRILVYFQPVIRNYTGKLCSFEALTRWQDPVYGFISPGVYIPVLEKHHRCYKLDAYVMEECCRMLSERMAAGLPCVPVSTNVSRSDFMMCDPVRIAKETCDRYQIDHRYICIEITESALMDTPEDLKIAIRRFREAGFQVWMDDFGSAYSSLNQLPEYSFDELKLDMAFMRKLNENSKIVVSSVVAMARQLGTHTLCEGVETKEQLEFLRDIGCEKIQGYYYGMPMPPEEQMRNLSEKKIEMEDRHEAAIMDLLGLLPLDYGEKFMLARMKGETFRSICASQSFRKELCEGEELPDNVDLDRILLNPESGKGDCVRRLLAKAASGSPGEQPVKDAESGYICGTVLEYEGEKILLIEKEE